MIGDASRSSTVHDVALCRPISHCVPSFLLPQGIREREVFALALLTWGTSMKATSIIRTPINLPSAWKATDFESKDDFAVELSQKNLAALDTLMRKAQDSGRDVHDLTRDDFDHPDINDKLAAVREEVMLGRGLVVLRRLPVERYSLEEASIIYWGIGTHFGKAVSQSVLGDRLGHVTDMTMDDPHARAYRNNFEGSIHTDKSDVVGMLSIRKAAIGGLSRYASVATIHNEILATRPDLLAPLYEGFPRHWGNEQKPGESPVTSENIPVIAYSNGLLACRFVRSPIEAAAVELGRPLTDKQRGALDYFEELSHRPDILFECMLEPGDISLMNNKTVLHGRTAFKDLDDPEQRRLLIRLWLDMPIGAPGVTDTDDNAFGRGGIEPQEGKTPSVDYSRYGLKPRPRVA